MARLKSAALAPLPARPTPPPPRPPPPVLYPLMEKCATGAAGSTALAAQEEEGS